MSDSCANQASGAANCPCTYPGCPRHGSCCQCVAYHRAKSQLPGCYFTPDEEKSYDRSIAFFVSRRKG